MRAVVQRVKKSKVDVAGKTIASIGEGLMVLVGVGQDDTREDLDYIFDKLVNLRIFEDADGKMNRSLLDVEGELLLVSQFTLYGDARKGRRPSFSSSARPEIAEEIYEELIERARSKGIVTESGDFGADMQVELVNDGPVTILLDSKRTF